MPGGIIDGGVLRNCWTVSAKASVASEYNIACLSLAEVRISLARLSTTYSASCNLLKDEP